MISSRGRRRDASRTVGQWCGVTLRLRLRLVAGRSCAAESFLAVHRKFPEFFSYFLEEIPSKAETADSSWVSRESLDSANERPKMAKKKIDFSKDPETITAKTKRHQVLVSRVELFDSSGKSLAAVNVRHTSKDYSRRLTMVSLGHLNHFAGFGGLSLDATRHGPNSGRDDLLLVRFNNRRLGNGTVKVTPLSERSERRPKHVGSPDTEPPVKPRATPLALAQALPLA